MINQTLRGLVCLLLSLFLLLTGLLTALAASRKIGDLNGDASLSVTDVVLLRKAILQGENSFDISGDLNGDRTLSVTDVVLLRKAILQGSDLGTLPETGSELPLDPDPNPSPEPDPAPAEESVYAQLAAPLEQAIHADFFPGAGLPLETLGESSTSFLWSYTAYLDALAWALTANPADAALQETYRTALDRLTQYRITTNGYTAYAPGAGGYGDLYYDDNSLVILAYCRGYQLLQDPDYLQEAVAVAEFVRTGWNDTLGGLWWNNNHQMSPFSATCATVAFGYANIMLYQATGEELYLTWAQNLYAWAQDNVQDAATGLYGNQVNMDGTREMSLWTYNSGYMLSIASALADLTGKSVYAMDAITLARASDRYFGQINAEGVYILGTAEPWFHLVLLEGYRNFAAVDAQSADVYIGHLANAVENGARHPKNDTVYVNRSWQAIATDRDQNTTLLDQCGTLGVLYLLDGYYTTQEQ